MAECRVAKYEPASAGEGTYPQVLREQIIVMWEHRWFSLDPPLRQRFQDHEVIADLQVLPRTVLQDSIDVHRKLRAVLVHGRRLMNGEELSTGCGCEALISQESTIGTTGHELVVTEAAMTRAVGGRPNTESVHGMCTCGWERYGSRSAVTVAHADHFAGQDEA